MIFTKFALHQQQNLQITMAFVSLQQCLLPLCYSLLVLLVTKNKQILLSVEPIRNRLDKYFK